MPWWLIIDSAQGQRWNPRQPLHANNVRGTRQLLCECSLVPVNVDRLDNRCRTGIYELVPVGEDMRKLIHEGASEAALERMACSAAPLNLGDGWRACCTGITSIKEVLRVTREE